MIISVFDQFLSAIISYIPLSIFWATANFSDLTTASVILTFYSIGLAFLRGTYFNLLVRGQTFRTSRGLFVFSLIVTFCVVFCLLIYLNFTFPRLMFREKLVTFSIAIALVQEILRERQIGAGRQKRALIGDAIWLFSTTAILIFLSFTQDLDLVTVFVGWGVGGLFSIFSLLLLNENRDNPIAQLLGPGGTTKELTYLALIPFVGPLHTLLYTYIYSREELLFYLFTTKAILFCTIPLNFVINFQQFALMRDLHTGNEDGVTKYFKRQKILILLVSFCSLLLFFIKFDSPTFNIGFGFAIAFSISILGILSNPEILRKMVDGKFKEIFVLRIFWLTISFSSFLVSTFFPSENFLLLALLLPDLLLFLFLKKQKRLSKS